MESVILSSWDYIMGPQIEQLWLRDSASSIAVSKLPSNILCDFNASKHFKNADDLNVPVYQNDMKIYSMMCGQLLLGEVDSCKDCQGSASRFYSSGEKILVSVIFHMKSWFYSGTMKELENVTLCFGVIFGRQTMNFVMNKHYLIDVQLRKIANFIQKSELSTESPDDEITIMVNDFVIMLDSLTHSSLSSIKISYQEGLQNSTNIFHKAVVSHLQSSGHTAVIGESVYKINEIIFALSLFSSENEHNNSVSVTQKPLKSGIHGIYIQGSVKKCQEECELLLEKAFKESLPLTVIDTDVSKVWQTIPFHSSEKQKNFNLVAETGSIVPQILSDLQFTERNGADIHDVLRNFFNFLSIKSVSIIKCIEQYREKGKVCSKKELMKMFSLTSVMDLQIYLGTAHKLKPGIRAYVS